MLDTDGFDKIAKLGAPLLLKNKYGATTEYLVIQWDINEFRTKNVFLRRLWNHLFPDNLTIGLGSAIIGAVLTYMACVFT